MICKPTNTPTKKALHVEPRNSSPDTDRPYYLWHDISIVYTTELPVASHLHTENPISTSRTLLVSLNSTPGSFPEPLPECGGGSQMSRQEVTGSLRTIRVGEDWRATSESAEVTVNDKSGSDHDLQYNRRLEVNEMIPPRHTSCRIIYGQDAELALKCCYKGWVTKSRYVAAR